MRVEQEESRTLKRLSRQQEEKAESATQKRIDRLTKKYAEAERQREQDALSMHKGAKRKHKSLNSAWKPLITNYVQEYSNRVESQMASAEGELARAMEVGDTNAVVEAQTKITSGY